MTITNSSTFADLVGILIGYINLILPVLTALALVLVVYSAYRYVLKAGDSHGKGSERQAIVWGLIALFVIVSVWGLVRFMCGTFLNNSSCNTTAQSRYRN
jgi:uncharacterized membrane-anchored protein